MIWWFERSIINKRFKLNYFWLSAVWRFKLNYFQSACGLRFEPSPAVWNAPLAVWISISVFVTDRQRVPGLDNLLADAKLDSHAPAALTWCCKKIGWFSWKLPNDCKLRKVFGPNCWSGRMITNLRDLYISYKFLTEIPPKCRRKFWRNGWLARP